MDVILEGLPQEYESAIALINSRFDPLDIEEIEALLLSHKYRLQKYRKSVVDATANLAQVNLTSTPVPSSSDSASQSQSKVKQPQDYAQDI